MSNSRRTLQDVRLRECCHGILIGAAFLGSGAGVIASSPTPVPSATDEEITFRNGDVTLRGTLITPATNRTHSAMVILGGSNWETRDDVRFAVYNFAVHDLAVLIFDQRGYGQSTGSRFPAFADSAQDALAAVAYLKTRGDIEKVGICGMSRGGWIAPLAASMSHDVGLLILFVAPAVSLVVQEQTRVESEMRADGFPQSAIDQAANLMKLKFDWARSHSNWEAYAEAIEKARAQPWFSYVGGPVSRDSPEWRLIELNGDYNPVSTLQHVTCPVLAFFGALDRNVLPETNVPLMERSLKEAGNNDYMIKVIPNANHALLLSKTGGRKETHETAQLAPGVSSTIREWLRAHGFGE